MSQGYRKYSQAYQKAAVNTMDQRKLIVMLYDGAIRFLTVAGRKIREKDFYESHTNMLKGKSIIAELLASLNMEQGGDIAINLQRLYAHMFNELIDANLNKDAAKVDYVVELLRELRSAWVEIQPPKTGNPVGGGPTGPSGPDRGGSKPVSVRG